MFVPNVRPKVQGEPDLNKGASWVKGTAEYFDSVGTHVVMGRGFRTLDTMTAPPLAVVNQELVKKGPLPLFLPN